MLADYTRTDLECQDCHEPLKVDNESSVISDLALGVPYECPNGHRWRLIDVVTPA